MYISDYSLEQYNSVRDILYNIIEQLGHHEYEHIIVCSNSSLLYPLKVSEKCGIKTYFTLKQSFRSLLCSRELSAIQKVGYIFKHILVNFIMSICSRIGHCYQKASCLSLYSKIFKKEKPDLVIYFSFSPKKGFSKICAKRKIPYISILYDTFIERPNISKNAALIENDEIVNAVGYFVPDFFMEGYLKHYSHANIHSYFLPLLIPKENVISALENSKRTYKFSYFGQMQSFRNSDGIKEIFKELGLSLEIFSAEKKVSDEVYIYHDAVSDEKLHKVVAESDFLVAFDNGEPYTHYLPSKAYLYVSFTKPIIVFGNNKHSALKDFLSQYPMYYYHNTDEDSLEGLISFINKKHPNKFDEEIYSVYKDYLPQNALKGIVALIENTIN